GDGGLRGVDRFRTSAQRRGGRRADLLSRLGRTATVSRGFWGGRVRVAVVWELRPESIHQADQEHDAAPPGLRAAEDLVGSVQVIDLEADAEPLVVTERDSRLDAAAHKKNPVPRHLAQTLIIELPDVVDSAEEDLTEGQQQVINVFPIFFLRYAPYLPATGESATDHERRQ